MNSTFWIITIICFIVFSIVFRKSKDVGKNIDPNDFVVRMSKTILGILIVVNVAFIWMFIVAITYYKTLMATFYASLLLLFGFSLIYLCYRWKIVIKDNNITVTPYFGETKTYTFDDITNVERGKNRTKVGYVEYIRAYNNEKMLFYITDVCPGFNTMISRLEKA